jgi:hypothetical protein
LENELKLKINFMKFFEFNGNNHVLVVGEKECDGCAFYINGKCTFESSERLVCVSQARNMIFKDVRELHKDLLTFIENSTEGTVTFDKKMIIENYFESIK